MGMPVTPLAYSAPMCGIGGRRLYIIITPGMKYYDVIINPYLLIGCNSQIFSCPVLLLSDSPPLFPAWVYGWCQGCCKSFVCIQYGQEERSAQDPVAISARIRMVLSRSVLCPVWLSSLLPPRAFPVCCQHPVLSSFSFEPRGLPFHIGFLQKFNMPADEK